MREGGWGTRLRLDGWFVRMPDHDREVDRRRHINSREGDLSSDWATYEERDLTWETPTIEEISCGMEVTAYAPADEGEREPVEPVHNERDL